MSLKNTVSKLVSAWEARKNPVEIAKLAYIIHLDFSSLLPSDIKDVVCDIMIMEADECMILTHSEIEILISRLKNFVLTLHD